MSASVAVAIATAFGIGDCPLMSGFFLCQEADIVTVPADPEPVVIGDCPLMSGFFLCPPVELPVEEIEVVPCDCPLMSGFFLCQAETRSMRVDQLK